MKIILSFRLVKKHVFTPNQTTTTLPSFRGRYVLSHASWVLDRGWGCMFHPFFLVYPSFLGFVPFPSTVFGNNLLLGHVIDQYNHLGTHVFTDTEPEHLYCILDQHDD